MKTRFYRIYRVLRIVKEFRSHFLNWDSMIKRLLLGKNLSTIEIRNGLLLSPGIGLHSISIYREIFVKNVYNPPGFEIKHGDVVIDIGANIGIFTLYAASQGCGQIYAFEPHPDNFSILLENIRINDLTNVKPYMVGVASKEEKGLLKVSSISGHHEVIDREKKNEFISVLEIRTINLEHFIKDNDIGPVDFLKIDCEGSEGDIFLSLSTKFFEKINKVVIEYHNNVSKLNDQQISKILKENNFHCVKQNINHSYGYIYAKKIIR